MTELRLTLAGRTVEGARDQIRRYCGLTWSGGPAETWAYAYFDRLPTGTKVTPQDVLAAATLHPGLRRSDLTFFHDNAAAINTWLSTIPLDTPLALADSETFEQLCNLVMLRPGNWDYLSLLSKVVHRKRPELIPIVNGCVWDWYRPGMPKRPTETEWPLLITALQADLRNEKNQQTFDSLRDELGAELGWSPPSDLRMLDITLWMNERAESYY